MNHASTGQVSYDVREFAIDVVRHVLVGACVSKHGALAVFGEREAHTTQVFVIL